MSHSVIKISKNINSLLSSGIKKTGFLFGAGASMCLGEELEEFNIPGVERLTKQIIDSLSGKYSVTIDAIKREKQTDFNVETLLTNINMRIEVIGSATIDGLDKTGLLELKQEIINEMKIILKKHLSIYSLEKEELLPHIKLAEWVKNTKKEKAIEIFTTNYDMLLEMALEHKKVRFLDGFYGSLHPFFDSSSINLSSSDINLKLWKIHGSLGWEESHNGIVKSNDGDTLLILPSILKYRESRKEPYIYFLDRLSSFIKSDDCVLITSGYSFNDQHINEIITDALKSCNNSLVVGLLYDKVWDEESKTYKFSLEEDEKLKRFAKDNSRLWILGESSAVIDGTYGKYEYNNISKDNLDITSNIFESDYNEEINQDKDKNYISASLKIVNTSKLFEYLVSMRLEHDKHEQ